MKPKTRAMVITVIVIVSVGFLAFSMMDLFVDPYLSVDSVVQNPDAYMSQRIQVKGKYLSGSLTITSSNVTLQMYGEQYTITVLVTGEVPNLQEDQELVAIGELQSSSLIIADEILAQCPSKYEANSTTTT
ncbi:MAG: cytochrome c maturation protein CcmE [Candidatus Thorarchaeota archaeon]